MISSTPGWLGEFGRAVLNCLAAALGGHLGDVQHLGRTLQSDCTVFTRTRPHVGRQIASRPASSALWLSVTCGLMQVVADDEGNDRIIIAVAGMAVAGYPDAGTCHPAIAGVDPSSPEPVRGFPDQICGCSLNLIVASEAAVDDHLEVALEARRHDDRQWAPRCVADALEGVAWLRGRSATPPALTSNTSSPRRIRN